jgi:hypothetical protein
MPHPTGGYKVDGKKVPGTTTIISRFKDSGGLLYWAAEQGKAIERGEINSLYDKRDEAGEAGTICHLILEEYITVFSTIPTAIEAAEKFKVFPHVAEQALRGVQNYLNWEQSNKMKIVSAEEELISREYLFGGCLDCVFEHNGVYSLGDFKTSNSIYPDFLCQLAAYKILWDESHPDMPIHGFHLLRFSKEHADFAHHYWEELEDAREQFLLFRRAYDLDKILKKRV